MPAKPGKDFVRHQLTKVLQSLQSTFPPMLLKKSLQMQGKGALLLQRDKRLPSVKKGPLFNNAFFHCRLSWIWVRTIFYLSDLTSFGEALVNAIEEGKGIQYLVFVINDPEITLINKHLIGFCIQFALHNFLFPKFLK
jgi:hypothetical protein